MAKKPASFVLGVIAVMAPGWAQVEPQPLPKGARDSGINILLDSGHQFSFFHHWEVQDRLRAAGHRVTGNQASLQLALAPGTPMRVRAQDNHAFGIERPFTKIPSPAFDVVFTYQHGKFQPYLPEERAALRRFVEAGGGLVADVSVSGSPAAEALEDYGAKLLPDPIDVVPPAGRDLIGLADPPLPRSLRAADLGSEWNAVLGNGKRQGSLAWRAFGKGIVVVLADPRLLRRRVDGKDVIAARLLEWAIVKAAGGPRSKNDGRRVPWEPEGLGGAFYPETEIEVGSLRVLYAGNQLPDIIELARTKCTEVMARLQKMLPTPPNPGAAFYINLAAGAGGGWAENAVTPKMAGTIAVDHDSILSILAHELAHTMYGPEAADGTPGCRLPDWWSEAHAGWFQRKVGRDMGFGERWPYFSKGLAGQDPLLRLDMANLKEGEVRLAWEKAWLIWSILDARYGPTWYSDWLARIHKIYNDPKRLLSMDEYIRTVSETVGEDLAALFERFGTTVGAAARTSLPPIGPKKEPAPSPPFRISEVARKSGGRVRGSKVPVIGFQPSPTDREYPRKPIGV